MTPANDDQITATYCVEKAAAALDDARTAATTELQMALVAIAERWHGLADTIAARVILPRHRG